MQIFVGRQREQQLYQDFLYEKKPWVLEIIGLGGNGKSTLLHHFAEQTPASTPVIQLDFTEVALRTDHLAILEIVSRETSRYCDQQRVTAFQQALARDREFAIPADSERTSHIHVSRSARRAAIKVQEPLDEVRQEIRYQTREVVMRALYAQLETFKPDHLVMMLDTCEFLNELEGAEIGQWLMNELLPSLHSLMQRQKKMFHVVIASRVPPPSDVIGDSEQIRIGLPMLDEAAVADYLTRLNMHDPELQQHIYELTHGHALCLAIIGTLWEEQGSQPFTLDDLPALQKEFNERAVIEFVQERLEKRLAPPFRKLLHYGVLLRRFNLPLLQFVFADFLSKSGGLDLFDRLIRYPHVEPLGNGYYTFHELIREVQTKRIREQEFDRWRLYHLRAKEYYDRITVSNQPLLHSPEWYYHAIAYDEAEGMAAFQAGILVAQSGQTSEYLNALLQVASDKALQLTPKALAVRAYEQGRSYHYTAQWELALQSYAQALFYCRLVMDHPGEANVLQAIGDIQLHTAQPDEALKNYERALSLFREVRDYRSAANVLKAMGDVAMLQARPDIETALMEYERSLHLYLETNNLAGQGNIRKAIGDVLQRCDRNEDALDCYRQSIALFRQAGDRFGEETVLQIVEVLQQSLADNEPRARITPILPELDSVELSPAAPQGIQPSIKESIVSYNSVGSPAELNLPVMSPPIVSTPGRKRRLYFLLLLLLIVLAILATVAVAITHLPGGSAAVRHIVTPTASASPFASQCDVAPALSTSKLDARGLGSFAAPDNENIGVSDGSTAFFDTSRSDNNAKTAAIVNYASDASSWQNVVSRDPSDAEARIYWENQLVRSLMQGSGRSSITLVVSVTFYSGFAGGGRDVLQGAYLAQTAYNLQHANDGSPLLLLLVANTGQEPAYSATVAQQIVNIARKDHSVAGVIGWSVSSQAYCATRILAKNNIPLVSPTASSNLLTGMPYFFRIAPPDSEQGYWGAKYAEGQLHAQNVIVFVDHTDAYSSSLAQSFEQQFQADRYHVYEETYTVGANDVTALPNKLQEALKRNAGTDLIYFAGYASDVSKLLASPLFDTPAYAHLQVMGGDALYVLGDYPSGFQSPPSHFDHLHFTTFAQYGEWAYLNSKGIDVGSLANFDSTYTKEFYSQDPTEQHPQIPDYGHPDDDVILSYDATNVMLKASGTAFNGSSVKTTDVYNALEKISGSNAYQGLSGRISFDEDGNPNKKTFVAIDVMRTSQNSYAFKIDSVINQGCFLVASNTCGNS